MATDLEEFERIIKEDKITTVDEMLTKSKEYAQNIPNLKENFNKIVQGRGSVLELSTILEIAFNELIIKMRKQEVNNISFMKKARIVKGLLEEVNTGEFSKEVLNKFERFVHLRNIFAHVPVNRNITSLKLEFNSKEPYSSFFKVESRWEDVSVAINEYMGIAGEILTTIPLYIKRVIQMENEIALQNKIEKLFNELESEDRLNK